MTVRPPYELPEDKKARLRRATRLEWISLGFLASIVIVMYLAKGSSQAMKTAWIEDILSLIPPIVFLLSMRYRDRAPNKEFPYGYRRCTLLAFMTSSAAVLLLGTYLFYESAKALLMMEHPTLGHYDLFGHYVWIGWIMLAALAYSVVPMVILGRMKLKLAEELHEKTLHADASMNKADWETGLAGMVGVVGMGFGLWWADAAAALFISFSIIKDGFGNLRGAMADLMDSRPHKISDGKPMHLEERLAETVRGIPGVSNAGARLREEGHTISGEVFVVLDGAEEVARKLQDISEQAQDIDWRLHNLVVTPVLKVRED